MKYNYRLKRSTKVHQVDYISSHEAKNFWLDKVILPEKMIPQQLKIHRTLKKSSKKKQHGLIPKFISSFCYSSIRSGVWLKAVSDEVMSFQSVSKSLVQIPSLLGQNILPPTPIKKEKKRKKLNQVIRMRCFDSNNVHSRLCAELSGSNPSTMVSNTKHMAKERCSHLILKTNTDNQLPPPSPHPSGPTCTMMLGPTWK